MAEKSSWNQANIRQKLGLVWRNRKKIRQIIKEYFYLPFFLLIILWEAASLAPPVQRGSSPCGSVEKKSSARRPIESPLKLPVYGAVCAYVSADESGRGGGDFVMGVYLYCIYVLFRIYTAVID